MKKSISIFLSVCVIGVMTLQTSCIGSFKLTNSFWDWNRGLDKWVGGIFFLLIGSWVSGITLFVDAIFLNLVEFWSGSNPMSMNEGDKEQQLVLGEDGNTYEVTVTKNRFEVVQLTGNNIGSTKALVYSTEDKSWTYENDCQSNKVLQFSENGEFVKIFSEDGRVATLPSSISDKNLAAKMISEQIENQLCVN